MRNLSPGEEKLLTAVIAATRKGAIPGAFVVRQNGYQFNVELDGYSHTVASPQEKIEFESALKTLVTKGLLRRTEKGGNAPAPHWEYALSGEALEQARHVPDESGS